MTANAIQVMRMCNAFQRAAFATQLVCRDSTRSVDDLFSYYGVQHTFPITTLKWPHHRLGGCIYGWNVFHWLRALPEPPQLIYGRCPYGLLAASGMGMPSVYEVHAPPANAARYVTEWTLFRSAHLRRVVFISRALRDEYIRQFSAVLRRKDLLVAHDAADELPGAIPHDSHFLDTSDSRPHIGYIGGLHQGKGAELVRRLAAVLPEMTFHIVGGTPQQLEEFRRRDVPANLRLHGYVNPGLSAVLARKFSAVMLPAARLVSGAGDRGNIARWMSPLKLFEYMAAGATIIASDLPVLREILQHEENSLLADPDNLDTWVDSLRRLANDDDLRRRLGRAALRQFLAEHTWTRRAQHVLQSI